MLDCFYFHKDELESGFVKLMDRLDQQDFKMIAKKLEITYTQVKKYASSEKAFVDVKVPELFIKAVYEIIEERTNKLKELKDKMDNL